jgi:hypothetical protein
VSSLTCSQIGLSPTHQPHKIGKRKIPALDTKLEWDKQYMKAKIWHNKLKRLRCFKIIEEEHNKSLHIHEANKQAPQSLQELQSPAKSLQLIRHKISWFRSQNYFLKNVDQHIKMNQVISWYTCNVSCKTLKCQKPYVITTTRANGTPSWKYGHNNDL